MKFSTPPALAAWLLDHMVIGGRNDALAGDLLEEFQRRCSPGWYWRQVLGAILASAAGQFRSHWKSLSLDAVLIWIWTYYSLLFLQFIRERFWATAFDPHGRFFWWVLLRCSGILSLVLPLVVFLAVTKFTNFLAALRGLCAGTVFLPVTLALLLRFGWGLQNGGNWVISWRFMVSSYILEAAGVLPYSIAHPWWLFPSAVIRQSAPLLFAIWAVQLSAKKGQSTTLQNKRGIEQ